MCPDETDKLQEALHSEERRQYVRLRKDVKLNCRIIGTAPKAEEGPVRNLSTGGLMLHTPRPLETGTRLQLEINMTSSGVRFKTGARVVWCEHAIHHSGYDVGVCFVGLDPDQRHNVIALVGSHLSDAGGLERRHYVRLPRRLIVDYKTGATFLHRWHTASAENISLGGVAIILTRYLVLGKTVWVRVYLDDAPDHPFKAKGKVISCIPHERHTKTWVAGVEFMGLEEAVRKRMAQYVSNMLTAPDIEEVTRPKIGESREAAILPDNEAAGEK